MGAPLFGGPSLIDFGDSARRWSSGIPGSATFDRIPRFGRSTTFTALRAAIERPERVASLCLCAVTGGIDVASLGAADWRASFRAENPELPTWFLDDSTNVTDALTTIHAPTLIVSGDADALSPVSVGEFLRERISSSKLAVIRGGTHWMANEDPDGVAAAISKAIESAH